MKVLRNYSNDPFWLMGRHPAIPQFNDRNQKAIDLIKQNELVPLDLDDHGWTNNETTLVLGFPDCSDREILENATEWLNEYMIDLMTIVALLKPDEFHVQSIKNNHATFKDFSFIIRMWWD